MRIAKTSSLKPGKRLAQTIYNDNGVVMLAKGMELTGRMIDRLVKSGITFIYIEDSQTEDIIARPVIPQKMRREATETIKETFCAIADKGTHDKAFLMNQNGKELGKIVDQIMNELVGEKNSLSLLTDVFIRDNYVFEHSLNVAIYTVGIAMELGFSERKLKEIGIGALLHDVGKIFIDQDILHKPGKLTEAEFKEMKSHTEIGYNYIRQQITLPTVVAHCAFQHHERLDGSGYPRGIKGKELHEYAKIIGVADVFDAVTSNRVYRSAMLPHEGLEILYGGGAMNQFDMKIVEAFKKCVAIYPVGISLTLSDGRKGIVLRQNPNMQERPVIRIIEENEAPVAEPYEIDLSKVTNVVVTMVEAD